MKHLSKLNLTLIAAIIVACAGLYLMQHQHHSREAASDSVLPGQDLRQEDSTLTILVPDNYEKYRKEMTDYVQAGAKDPLKTFHFKKKVVSYTPGKDLLRSSAQAAAAELPPSGGPEQASVSYFRIVGDTAYVLLDIDQDHWAGSSVSIAEIHPLVEKTLLQYAEIDRVIFNRAPGD